MLIIMKKVLMLLSNPFKPDPRVYKEAKSLVKNGYDVTILCWDRELKFLEKEIVDGIKVERIRLKSGYGFKNLIFKLPIFWSKLFFRAKKMNFDIVHSHDFDTAVVAYFLKKLKNKKWVYDSHDLYFTYFPVNSFISRIIKYLDIVLARCCDKLIVPTETIEGEFEGLKEFYIKNGVEKEKITTIWNVPDLKLFLKHKKLNLRKSKKFTIGFIGGQRTTLNFIMLFETIKSKPDEYKILLIGEGKDTKKLKEIVRKKYSNLDIEFIRDVDYKLIPNYYKLLDIVFCFDLRQKEKLNNAIPIKLFEAAILGIPTITNEESLMSDFVKKYKCGITIKKATINELRRVIIKSKKIKFDPKRIRKEWCWKREEEKLISNYKTILNDN